MARASTGASPSSSRSTTASPTKHDGEPHVARKWVYVWAADNLGLMVVEARSVTVKDAWGHEHVVGGFGDVGGSKRSTDHEKG